MPDESDAMQLPDLPIIEDDDVTVSELPKPMKNSRITMTKKPQKTSSGKS